MKYIISLKQFITYVLLLLLVRTATVHAQPDSTIRYRPLGSLIDIGGWKLHLYGQGTHIDNGPTVIIENGLRGFSFDWTFVQSEVAAFARVYTYDRAGSAWSDLGPRPHTMHQAAYELYTLLKKAKVPPPYILVGASYGGFIVRLVAQQHPEEVAGIILVDSGNEDGILYMNGKRVRASTDARTIEIPPIKTSATQEDNNLAQTPEAKKLIGSALEKIGVPTRVEAPFNSLPDSVQAMRLWALSQFEFYAANDNQFILEERLSMISDREKKSLMFGDMPFIILTAWESETQHTEEEQDRLGKQKDLLSLSSNSKQILVKESGHHIHLEQPEIVVESIKEVVEAVRKKERLKK